MSGTEPTAAEIEAAAVALARWQFGPLAEQMNDETKKLIVERAFIAARAVVPLVVARVRADIADEIEALREAHIQKYGNEEPAARGEDWGYTYAARIARGTGEPQ